MTCERYLELESQLELTTYSYHNDEHDAYGAAVLIAMHCVLGMNDAQFKKCLAWFSNTLAKMILCDDIDIRNSVCEIYLQRINPLLA